MQVLLYDGLCGFCNWTVQFVLARDPGGSLKFSPLQGQFASTILAQRPELRSVDSLVLVTAADAVRPEVAVRSAAVLGVAEYLGWPWKSALVLRLVPGPLRDWAYDLFARNRHRWFGRKESCPLPSPEQRLRFLA